ncbi:MAG: site-2 protease family protein [Clostridia bacterium]|nr:site-2 protease family protein [Clostridia bacterium]
MNQWILETLAILPGIIIGISFHEFAHAKTAVKLGDDTPKLQGRVTLNPIKHIDIIGLICLIIAHFGWGKPVQINPYNFKKPFRDQMFVSLAGPVMNLLLAFVTLVIWGILYISGLFNGLSENVVMVLNTVFYLTAQINIVLFVFNLLPIPPLDGAKILMYFVPDRFKVLLMNLERYSLIIFLLIILSPISEWVLLPTISWIMNGMMWLLSFVFPMFG